MTDAVTIALEIIAGILLLALLFALAIGAAWILRETRKRRAYEDAGVSHLDLYFDEHFPNVIRNFDLVSNARFDTWSNGISARLMGLGKDIDDLGKARRNLDTRMDRLEKRLGEVE